MLVVLVVPVVLVGVTFGEDFAGALPGRTDLGRTARQRPEGRDRIVADLDGHAGDLRVTKGPAIRRPRPACVRRAPVTSHNER